MRIHILNNFLTDKQTKLHLLYCIQILHCCGIHTILLCIVNKHLNIILYLFFLFCVVHFQHHIVTLVLAGHI